VVKRCPPGREDANKGLKIFERRAFASFRGLSASVESAMAVMDRERWQLLDSIGTGPGGNRERFFVILWAFSS
jgi:hypothetical protein